MDFDRSVEWGKRAHRVIPAGSHTYAKGDDQYPAGMAPMLVRGQDCRVWDADGNQYIEYGMGLRAVTLGHGYPAVVDAAMAAMADGANFVRPTTLEVQAAERIDGLFDAADMVKFAKNGSDVTSAAVRLARAYTGRDVVAICAEDPFLSADDWFMGTTTLSAGIPSVTSDLTVRFRYNDLASLHELFAEHPGRIACVVMEAERSTPPLAGFLEGVQALCRREGALFVLDEMITGYRWSLGGAQQVYGLDPDLSAFGKAMANGFAVSALVGKRAIMELGALETKDSERLFLLSYTHGAERHALAAAIATADVYEQEGVVEHLEWAGSLLREGVTDAARHRGVDEHFEVLGRPSNLVYATRDADGEPSQLLRTLFLQETIRQGLLMPSMAVSLAHTEPVIAQTVHACDAAFAVYAKALADGIDHHLEGRPVRPVFPAR